MVGSLTGPVDGLAAAQGLYDQLAADLDAVDSQPEPLISVPRPFTTAAVVR